MGSTSQLLTPSEGALVLAEGEAGVGSRGSEEAGGGAGRGRGLAEKTAGSRGHWVGWAFPARLVVLQPQLLQGEEETTSSNNKTEFLVAAFKSRRVKTDLQRLVLVLLHGSDALVLRIDARCHARLHHCVTSCRRLKKGKQI